MIPKIIHYCWFGKGLMPQSQKKCIEGWKKLMPDYQFMLWDESTFNVNICDFTVAAYKKKKYAYVADVARLYALSEYGGIYLDTDVEVFKSFDDLLGCHAFVGFEGSKHLPIGTCVMASEANGIWVKEMLCNYNSRHFVMTDGKFDMTTNVEFISSKMREQGFLQNGIEQDYKDLHVFPVEYFCPRQTTGEYIKTEKTYCDHLGLGSWVEDRGGWKTLIERIVGRQNMILLIKLKRKLFR
jgi:hypothetical protein